MKKRGLFCSHFGGRKSRIRQPCVFIFWCRCKGRWYVGGRICESNLMVSQKIRVAQVRFALLWEFTVIGTQWGFHEDYVNYFQGQHLQGIPTWLHHLMFSVPHTLVQWRQNFQHKNLERHSTYPNCSNNIGSYCVNLRTGGKEFIMVISNWDYVLVPLFKAAWWWLRDLWGFLSKMRITPHCWLF